jgi:fructokinase
MQRAFLLPRIRYHAQKQLAGYIRQPALLEGMDQYLVAPGLGSRSGVLGALALAAAQADRHFGETHA